MPFPTPEMTPEKLLLASELINNQCSLLALILTRQNDETYLRKPERTSSWQRPTRSRGDNGREMPRAKWNAMLEKSLISPVAVTVT